MATSATSRASSISQHLHATKEILHSAISNARIADKAEVDVLVQDAFEILLLIRSWSDSLLAPINRIPSETPALIPDSWDLDQKDRWTIGLTHVCRAWRDIFISRSSLWGDFYCRDEGKTRVYLERSKSSPINVTLIRSHDLSPDDPLLQIVPHAIGRLKSLYVGTTPGSFPDIISRLSLPAPLLEDLTIDGGYVYSPQWNPVLTPALFNGDLSSLRELHLLSVRTELPWRDMANLTSFTLVSTSQGEVSVGHLLDFFESAPRLREVFLHYATPTSSAQNGRLLSLSCLKRIEIIGDEPSSLLLDHLLIPVGAKLTTQVDSLGPLIEDHLPKSLDNLRNLSGFTDIHLYAAGRYPRVQFSGLNGKVTMNSVARTDTTHVALKSLARFDTSKVERLEINCNDILSRDLPYQTLLPMEGLRTLMLSHSRSSHGFIAALHPNTSSSEVAVCPELEELVLAFPIDRETFDMKDVVGMAADRASRGMKLKSVGIVNHDKVMQIDSSELERHVLHVEYGLDVEYDDTSDEES